MFDHTMFKGIHRVPQAALIQLTRKEHRISRYWSFQYKDPEEKSDEEHCDTFDDLIRQSVRRVGRIVNNAFLSLSGGVDSRIVLGYFLQEYTGDIHIVSYGGAKEPGDDSIIAQTIAENLHLPCDVKTIKIEDFPSGVPDVLAILDGRIEIIDALPLMNIWNELAKQFTTIINGHQCFSLDHRIIEEAAAAVADPDIGFFRLDQVDRMVNWLRKNAVQDVREGIGKRLKFIVTDHAEDQPKLFKEKLYYLQRLGNYLNGFSGAKLRVFEQVRPLLDEDIIDAGLRLPTRLREDKKILRLVLERKLSNLSHYGFAKKPFLLKEIDYLNYMRSRSDAYDSFREEIINLVPELDNVLDKIKILETCDSMIKGECLPVCGLKWFHRIPGLWRLIPPKSESRVSPLWLAIRLYQTNKFIRQARGW